MSSIAGVPSIVSARSVRTQRLLSSRRLVSRPFTESRHSAFRISHARQDEKPSSNDASHKATQQGAMSRRLSEMSDTSLEEGGSGARKSVEAAGFDEELKEKLLARLESAKFKQENRKAFTEAEMPSYADQSAKEHAKADAWTGEESIEDATLRMLTDSYKPMKSPPKKPQTRGGAPKRVDTGRPKKKPSSGVRLANAKERSTVYASSKEDPLTEKEREERKKIMREKFQRESRPVPISIQGLQSLANERIEDAIARGQFKNLPRGKPMERDYNASNPFLDTTEYFMNKIIQKQDLVPPWIEKQQELVSTATRFRTRIRADWRRHAARLISSVGGSMESQIKRAQEYAAAEAIVNPPTKKKIEKVNTVDAKGHLSQITLSGDLQIPKPSANESEQEAHITVTEEIVTTLAADDSVDTKSDKEVLVDHQQPLQSTTNTSNVSLFRDPQWERAEKSYHQVAIDNLNAMTRAYNLMAPNLARKPYYSLDRELQACFAEVAPQLAAEIRNRATMPNVQIEITGSREGGVLEHFSSGNARVYDERRPRYGFREFWRDLFGAKQST